MTGAELRAAREGLALPRAALAEELGVPEQQVWDWESGVARIPSRSAALVAYKAALARREAAMESSGLPACTFVREWNAQPMPPGTEPQLRRLEALARHARSCPTCVARDLHARGHLPPLPRRPAGGPAGVVGWAWDRIEALPAWARPPIAGGVIVTA
ncbi:MAG TPA: hypothetical protein VFE05_07495, partial [Longimicrobiaceae bacterium]|nr:hypothetical protein [Longimicrobiaceae bacterium]